MFTDTLLCLSLSFISDKLNTDKTLLNVHSLKMLTPISFFHWLFWNNSDYLFKSSNSSQKGFKERGDKNILEYTFILTGSRLSCLLQIWAEYQICLKLCVIFHHLISEAIQFVSLPQRIPYKNENLYFPSVFSVLVRLIPRPQFW